jgi:iron(III) transport system substrate-binding protein
LIARRKGGQRLGPGEEEDMKRLLALLAIVVLLPQSARAENGGWKQSWEETVAAAKQEGKVVVSGPPSTELRKVLPAAFKARYGITVDYFGGRSTETATRMRAERQAGIHSVDVIFAGIQSMALTFHREKMLQPLKPALQLPEVVDGSKWKKGSLWFADPDEQYILRLSNTVTTMFHVNTSEVKPGEIRSVKDMLNPKWKGKIALQDPTIPGSGSNQAAHLYFQHGEDFVKALYVDQKPMISRDTRQITDGLARGTYAICLGAEDADVEKLRKDGVPVAILENLPDLYPEISASFGQVAMIDNAPHPNAAKVFVNWIASKEGSEVLNRAMGTAPTRNDIDESFLPPEIIPKEGVKYFDTFDWEFTVTKKEQVRQRMKELLRPK